MERKLFAFDIDGTLLNSEKKALDSTREALAKLREQGHLVTLATGRSRYMAQEVIWDLDFTNYVLCNGAAAFVDHEQYYQNLLHAEALERLAQDSDQRGLGFACVGLDDIKKSNQHRAEKMEIAMNTFIVKMIFTKRWLFMTQKISVRLKKNTQNFALFAGINIA